MTDSTVTIGSGDHRVLGLHGWFGSARGWDARPGSWPVMEHTWLQFYPAAELEVMPNAGHYPMFETPAALAASIEEFLGRD
jgi:hypothetical protein